MSLDKNSLSYRTMATSKGKFRFRQFWKEFKIFIFPLCQNKASGCKTEAKFSFRDCVHSLMSLTLINIERIYFNSFWALKHLRQNNLIKFNYIFFTLFEAFEQITMKVKTTFWLASSTFQHEKNVFCKNIPQNENREKFVVALWKSSFMKNCWSLKHHHN